MKDSKAGSAKHKGGTFFEDMELALPYARAAMAGEPAEKTPEIAAALKRLEPFFKHS